MIGAPTFVVLETFLFFYEDGFATELLPRIRKAWENVIRMERDYRSWALDKEVTYQQWLAEWVRKVKLPFRLISPDIIKEESISEEEPKEITRLKKEVKELKSEKMRLTSNLHNLCHNYASLERDHEGIAKKQKERRKYTLMLKQDLAVANTKISMTAQERDAALFTKCQWKTLYDNTKKDKQEALRKLQDLQVKVNDME